MKKNNAIFKNQEGMTLVEVIVAVGVIVVVLTGFMASLTKSLGNVQFARNKTLATKYAQEGVEWIRSQRDQNDWATFFAYGSDLLSDEEDGYCLPVLNTWPEKLACSSTNTADYIPNTPFLRDAVLIQDATDRITVNVLVTWQRGNQSHQVSLITYLTNWQ